MLLPLLISFLGLASVAINVILFSRLETLKKVIHEQDKQLHAQQRVIFHLYQSKANINRQIEELPK